MLLGFSISLVGSRFISIMLPHAYNIFHYVGRSTLDSILAVD